MIDLFTENLGGWGVVLITFFMPGAQVEVVVNVCYV